MKDQYVDLSTLKFLLFDVHKLSRILEMNRFREYDTSAINDYLDSVKEFSDKEMYPYFREMDRDPAFYRDGEIIVHPQVVRFLKLCGESGFIGATFEQDTGGLQLPNMVLSAAAFIKETANNHLPGYAGLTAGAAELIQHFGSESLKKMYVPNMLAGEWSGTMCLTEPQAGSSLSDIVTSAVPDGEAYKIHGQKIFISGGDYRGVKNVVHLLLARIEGAPAGTKGISLFVVPKLRPEKDGTLHPNDVNTLGDFQKLGQKGYCTTHLSFGDGDDCRGWLVGNANEGLNYMFKMMNTARIAVGRGAAAIATAAYHSSLTYARERPQGRKLSSSGDKNPQEEQTLIINHPDVKRMLMSQRVVAEGSLSLVLLSARYQDLAESHSDPETRKKYNHLLDILTPLTKTYPAEKGIDSVSAGLQVLGGYGFCEDFVLQQYYRDIRIFSIYEGTTGIQSLDLLGRKMTMENGMAYKLLMDEIRETVSRASETEVLKPAADVLRSTISLTDEIVNFLMEFAQKGDYERFLSDATILMEYMGIIVVGWQWLEIALTAIDPEKGGNESTAFTRAKLQAMKFYFRYEMPKAIGLSVTLMDKEAITLQDDSELFS
ncbi:acyl-CoA dehydrogenase [Fulvivirga sedimenti]|uniref:Acyl-CoA dehydrogenase n=1 Tax=Fulvivirga sedimenti TaxID=2879465 RepID=A0A9X1KYB6_9BACT|nr:acyl-CoA dehydrogenase [Fulvivirga sedimenti]MCA6074667.1 acyl-CoA dehydrogenase [Fulvivirga sedimenti]MCA6075844.1 acyl-CoA dehydrogenase [Fulvivirga sedimenti]MCA6076972.1 acyl-CoA dehydrogenase [Fulvivirga sedimenti]